MPRRVEHHGRPMTLDDDYEHQPPGPSRSGLCWKCENFAPGHKHNCNIADALFGLTKLAGFIAPIKGCSEFQEGQPDLSTIV